MTSKNLLTIGAVIIGSLFFSSEVIWAQQVSVKLSEIPAPKPATIGQPSLISVTGVPNSFFSPTPISPEPLAVWQADKERIARHQVIMEEIYRELSETGRAYQFPNMDHLFGVQAYHQAYEELRAMLDEEVPLDLKKAIFAVENAYYNNQGSFDHFDKQIKDLAGLASTYINQQGWDRNNPMAPLLALHHLFADTLVIDKPGMEEAIVHYPIEYDFEDFWGRKDLANVFVSKVLATGSGQCYSLPQLYLLLAEELGSDAWLSFSPNHSYIKFKDNENQWYNLELTNGNLVSESWMMASG